MTTRPKNPYTTDGTPARAFIEGTSTRRTAGGAISAKNTAHATPRGVPMPIAPNVTISEPTIIGKMPHEPFERLSAGCQMLDIKNWGPAARRKGSPSLKINQMIRNIAATAETAQSKRMSSMVVPFASFILDLLSVRTATFGFIHITPFKKEGRLVFYFVADAVIDAFCASLIETKPSAFNSACPPEPSVKLRN